MCLLLAIYKGIFGINVNCESMEIYNRYLLLRHRKRVSVFAEGKAINADPSWAIQDTSRTVTSLLTV